MKAILRPGDCRDVLLDMALDGELYDSVVTDPPYDLTSRVQRFGKPDSAPAKSNGATGVYARAARGFMGKTWDGTGVAFDPETWAAVYEVMKPGAYLVAFGGTRTFHRMACAIEDAGFEIRDTVSYLYDGGLSGPLLWCYGTGFPKSLDVSKQLDKMSGAQREVVGPRPNVHSRGEHRLNEGWRRPWMDDPDAVERSRMQTAPATPEAAKWAGWGTALKPAVELIVLARKPLQGTVAENVLAHGVGGLNIDACRIPTSERIKTTNGSTNEVYGDLSYNAGTTWESHAAGRWPANLVHSGEPEVLAAFAEFGERAGSHNQKSSQSHNSTFTGTGKYDGRGHNDTGSAARFFTSCPPDGRWPANLVHDGSEEVEAAFAAFGERTSGKDDGRRGTGGIWSPSSGVPCGPQYGDTGTASRFFYCAKASAKDRCGSKHPTVKPLSLLRWLITLTTPPGGRVLDPFAGSGTTLQAAAEFGFSVVGIEKEREYQEDILRRIAAMQSEMDALLCA